jgi:hypothetical protein
MPSAEEGVVRRFSRMLHRLWYRNMWHWKGVLQWLVQRPHIRRFALPLPGVTTVAQYMQQPGSQPRRRNGHSKVPLTPAVLLGLVDLRNKMGMMTAYLEDPTMLAAINALRWRRSMRCEPRKAPCNFFVHKQRSR